MTDALFPLVVVHCFWGWCDHVETGFARPLSTTRWSTTTAPATNPTSPR